MTTYHNFKISLGPHDGRRTLGSVEIDGKPVHGVRAIQVLAGHDRVTEVTLTLIASVDMEVEKPIVTMQDEGA